MACIDSSSKDLCRAQTRRRHPRPRPHISDIEVAGTKVQKMPQCHTCSAVIAATDSAADDPYAPDSKTCMCCRHYLLSGAFDTDLRSRQQTIRCRACTLSPGSRGFWRRNEHRAVEATAREHARRNERAEVVSAMIGRLPPPLPVRRNRTFWRRRRLSKKQKRFKQKKPKAAPQGDNVE